MAKLDAKAFGLACGIIWGALMFIMGMADVYSTWGDRFGSVMASVYIGYSPTIVGSIIGGVWGFIDAGIGGAVLAWLYNKFAK
ncbi:MAG: bacteriophage holin [Candidatus Omnitrophica bacterium]|nr:bacteriophage holin [Candidatus Omnitrophota bacterium]